MLQRWTSRGATPPRPASGAVRKLAVAGRWRGTADFGGFPAYLRKHSFFQKNEVYKNK